MLQSHEELKPNNPQTLTSHCKLTTTRKPPAKKPQCDEFTVHVNATVVKPYDNRFVLVLVAKIQVCRICEKMTITDIVKTK